MKVTYWMGQTKCEEGFTYDLTWISNFPPFAALDNTVSLSFIHFSPLPALYLLTDWF